MGRGAAVRPQTNNAIWDGVIGLWGRVAPPLVALVWQEGIANGCELEPVLRFKYHVFVGIAITNPCSAHRIRLSSKVSMSLGNSVEFKVRRRGQGKVPSLITLDHGDLLVMDGLTQSEYVHCTASGLQGPRVNLTFRWVAQHIASCPLAGVVGLCSPNVCARFSRAMVPVGWERGKINGPLLGDWSSFC